MPSATAREFQSVALALGFVRRRQTGSHERWTHSDGRSVTIPLHGGREIGPPLFFKILRQLRVSLEEFDRLRCQPKPGPPRFQTLRLSSPRLSAEVRPAAIDASY